MKKPSIFLHIGVHKTGSTLLQDALIKNAQSLSQVGVSYVILDRVRFYGELKQLFSTAPSRDVAGIVDKLRKQVREDVASHDGNTVVISNETFSSPRLIGGRLYGNSDFNADVIQQVFQSYSPHIVMYVRRQDRFLESCYSFSLKKGSAKTFDQFMETVDPEQLDWNTLVQPFVARFGAPNVTIRPFESILNGRNAFLSTFFSSVAPHAPKSLFDFEQRFNENRSYSDTGMKMALRCNRLLDAEQKVLFRRFLETNFSAESHSKPVLLTQAHRDGLVTRYQDKNRALFSQYMASFDPKLWE